MAPPTSMFAMPLKIRNRLAGPLPSDKWHPLSIPCIRGPSIVVGFPFQAVARKRSTLGSRTHAWSGTYLRALWAPEEDDKELFISHVTGNEEEGGSEICMRFPDTMNDAPESNKSDILRSL